jgi:nitrite reductase/ring-hydroxylating ferredoxin subunit
VSSKVFKLARLQDIPDGAAKGFDLHAEGRDQLFVIRQGDEYHAWYNLCPHTGYEGTSMAWKKDAYLNKAKTKIFCAAHGAQFEIQSGLCFRGPCLGQSLVKADVRLDEEGVLHWHQ